MPWVILPIKIMVSVLFHKLVIPFLLRSYSARYYIIKCNLIWNRTLVIHLSWNCQTCCHLWLVSCCNKVQTFCRSGRAWNSEISCNHHKSSGLLQYQIYGCCNFAMLMSGPHTFFGVVLHFGAPLLCQCLHLYDRRKKKPWFWVKLAISLEEPFVLSW